LQTFLNAVAAEVAALIVQQTGSKRNVVVVWAWLALVDSRQALNSLDALEGMHFDR
jgi:hypothetical protein